MIDLQKIIIYVLLGLVIILLIVMIVKMNEQTKVIMSKSASEGFTTTNAAFNRAAGYTTGNNYLMPSSFNDKYRQKSSFFIPDNYSSRGGHPMNALVPEKQKMFLPDANSLTGYYPSVGFPPSSINSNIFTKNPAKIETSTIPEIKLETKTETPITTVSETPTPTIATPTLADLPLQIPSETPLIEGANVKLDKVHHIETQPVETQNTHTAIIEQNDEDLRGIETAMNNLLRRYFFCLIRSV